MHTFFHKEYEQLTNTEKYIVDYLNKFPKQFYLNNIETIAAEAFVSTASISRLYNKLGFESLKEMQFYVYHNLIVYESNSNKQNEKNIINNIFGYYYYSIAETKRNLDLSELKKKIKYISIFENIYIFGMGKSKNAANNLASNLQKTDKKVFYSNDFPTFLESLLKLNNNSLVILFSHSGTSKEFRFIYQYFKDNNTNFLVISGNKFIKNKTKNCIIYDVHNDKYNRDLLNVSQNFIADIIFLFLKGNLPNLQNNLIDKWNKK